MKHSETKPQPNSASAAKQLCGKSPLVVITERRIPLGSKQKAERDSSRKIGAQNDDFLNFSAEEFKD